MASMFAGRADPTIHAPKTSVLKKASDIRNQTLTEEMNIVDLVAELPIEGKNSLVILPNTETHFRAASFDEVTARRINSAPRPARMLRGDRQVVDASAMAVIADHDRCNDDTVHFGNPPPVKVGHLSR